MIIYALAGLCTTFTGSFVAVFVYLKNRKNFTNRLYILFNLVFAYWGIGYAKMVSASTQESGLFWSRALHLGAFLVPLFFLHFALAFLNLNKKKKTVLRSCYLCCGILFLLLPTKLFVKSASQKFYFNYFIDPGVCYHLFSLFFYFCVGYALFYLFRGFRQEKGVRREQIKYVFFSYFLAFSSGFFAFLPLFGINTPRYGLFCLPLSMIIFTYAVVKYQLMEIRVVISRALVFISVFIPMLLIPLLFTIWNKQLLITLLGENYWFVPTVLEGFLAILGLALFRRIQISAEQKIFKEEYMHERAIKKLSEELVQFENINDLSKFLTRELKNIAALSSVAVHFNDELSCAKEGMNEIISFTREKKDLLFYEQLLQEHSSLAETMKSMNTQVIVPILEKDNLLGLILLGGKTNGRMFTNIELMAFKVLAYQIALQLQSIQFVQTMRKQIQQKEAEKAANLENLIAGIAHNLKTPIMSSAGGVSIINEITNKMQESRADKTYAQEIQSWTSDIRENLEYMDDIMKQVRKHMSNVEAGGENTCFLEEIIEKITMLMSHELKTHNSTINIENTYSNNPQINGNINDILQVLNVFISNAIDSYQGKGQEVRLSFLDSNDHVKILVEDDGIGIPTKVQEQIFKKMITTKGKYGRGLGLYLLYPMVRGRLGGDIGFTSNIAEGSTFWITIKK